VSGVVPLDGCIGFTDRSFTVLCPQPAACEIRVKRDGELGGWRKVCARHADSTMEVLGQADGYGVERRDLCGSCPGVLRDGMRELGTEVTVSTIPPVVAGPYTTEPFTCPHGVTYWIEPTGDQIAVWAQERVE
jgi:hypothetical protein